MFDEGIKTNLICFLKLRVYTWALLLGLKKDISILENESHPIKYFLTLHVHRDEQIYEELALNKYINLEKCIVRRNDIDMTKLECVFSFIEKKKNIKHTFIFPTIVLSDQKDYYTQYTNIESDDTSVTHIYPNIIYFIKKNEKTPFTASNAPIYDIIPKEMLYKAAKFNFFNYYPINEVTIINEDNYANYLDYINNPIKKNTKLKNINKFENIFYILFHALLLDHSKTKGIIFVSSDPEITLDIDYRIC